MQYSFSASDTRYTAELDKALMSGDVEAVSICLRSIPKDDRRALLKPAFAKAAGRGDVQTMQFLVAQYKVQVDRPLRERSLYHAAKNGRANVVFFLVSKEDKSPEAIEAKSFAFHWACVWGKISLGKKLLNTGAVVSENSMTFADAVENNQPDAAEFLLKSGFDCDKEFRRNLYWALEKERYDWALKFLDSERIQNHITILSSTLKTYPPNSRDPVKSEEHVMFRERVKQILSTAASVSYAAKKAAKTAPHRPVGKHSSPSATLLAVFGNVPSTPKTWDCD